MSASPFIHKKPFPLGKDTTAYRLVTRDHVSVKDFNGQPVLVIEPEGLELLAHEAVKDISFMLRPSHLEQVAAILDDPESSENDRYVALAMLRNAEVAARGILPFCQDTGTATVVAKKGQQVWTGGGDENALCKGIHKTYNEENLRYSQTIAL
ncbi:MAG TPA: fumarate hydratase, partial [Oceanipulchritudo sp.]|nr:fumarate hydratase [Oceanipulchritudo sp.]